MQWGGLRTRAGEKKEASEKKREELNRVHERGLADRQIEESDTCEQCDSAVRVSGEVHEDPIRRSVARGDASRLLANRPCSWIRTA